VGFEVDGDGLLCGDEFSEEPDPLDKMLMFSAISRFGWSGDPSN
jgi:hypothetical protein